MYTEELEEILFGALLAASVLEIMATSGNDGLSLLLLLATIKVPSLQDMKRTLLTAN